MTEPTAPPPHLDDESLSELIDGEGEPGGGAHVEACSTCSNRLARLRRAAAAVAAPAGAPDPRRRAAAIAAAVAEAGSDGARGTVVSIGDAPSRRGAPRWLVAAAVLVVVAVAVPLVARLTDRGGTDDVAQTTALSADDSSAGAAAPVATAPRDAGDLGDVDAKTDLPAVLGLPAPGPAASTFAAPTTTVATGGGGRNADAAAESAGAPCETSVREDDPRLGALLVVARAHFDGDPVAVLGFEAGGQIRVYAVAVDSCAIRTVQTAL